MWCLILHGEPLTDLIQGQPGDERAGLGSAGLAQQDPVDGGERLLGLEPALDGGRIQHVLDGLSIHLGPEPRRDLTQVLALLVVECCGRLLRLGRVEQPQPHRLGSPLRGPVAGVAEIIRQPFPDRLLVPTTPQHLCGGFRINAYGLGDGDEMGEGNVGLAGLCAVLVHKAREAALQVDVEATGGVAAKDDAPDGSWWHYPQEILRQEHDTPRAAHVPAALEPYPLVLVAARYPIVEHLARHPVSGIGRAAATGVILAERLEGYSQRLPPGRELDPPTKLALAPGVIGAAFPAVLVQVEDTGTLRNMGHHQVPSKLPRFRPRQVGRPVLGHLSLRDVLKNLAQLVGVLDGLAGYFGVDAPLVQLVRAEHLYVHLHFSERLFERHEKMLGVGDMAALGVRYVREASADVFLVALGDTWDYLAKRVDRVRVKDKANLLTALPQSVRDRLGDDDLAQVAGVDVTGDADAAHDHVRPRAQRIGDPISPAGYVNAGRPAGLAHAVLQLGSVVGIGEKRATGVLAGRLDVDDLVLRRAAGG